MSRIALWISLVVMVLIACPSATVASNVFNKTLNARTSQIPVTGGKAFSGCASPVIPSLNADWEQSVVEQTNEVRMQNGLPPLKRVTGLDEAARYHSADMSINNYFDHNTLNRVNGKLIEACDTWNRIEHYYTNWQALAENIAAGQTSPQMAMDGWMHSPEHRDNIMSDQYWEMGSGFYQGPGDYQYYWDQDFGRRDGIFPLVIDGEKAQTHTSNVPVYIYGNFKQMRLRNDNGSWGKWMPFEHSFAWTLPNTAGIHTVTAELTGPDGHTTTSDTIEVAH